MLDAPSLALDITLMLNLLSILIGLAALAPILFALLPLLG